MSWSWEALVPPDHPLAPAVALRALPRPVAALFDTTGLELWERETRTLPASLARYRRQVRDFAHRELVPRALAADAAHGGPAADAVLAAAARAGLLTDLLPAPWGTLPWRRARWPVAWAYALKMEELCAACGGLGLLIGAHALGAMPLLLALDLGILRRVVLPAFRRIRHGELELFAFAITEPAAGSEVEDSAAGARYRPRTVARRVAGGWRISGRKVFISDGDRATWISLFASLEGEGLESWSCFLVRSDDPGFTVVRTERKLGQRASGAAELLLEDVFVPDDRVVGGLRRGWALNRATLDLSRIPVGAIALGIARGALDRFVALARRTHLGGRPLLHRQEVHLEVAELQTRLAAARALIWATARRWRVDQASSSMCKVFASDTAVAVTRRLLELAGAWGLALEPHLEKAYRDARLTQIYEGTNQVNLVAIVEDQLPTWSATSEGGSP